MGRRAGKFPVKGGPRDGWKVRSERKKPRHPGVLQSPLTVSNRQPPYREREERARRRRLRPTGQRGPRASSRRACPASSRWAMFRSGSVKRCATAVGEGAMVVHFVHERFSADVVEVPPAAGSRHRSTLRPTSPSPPEPYEESVPLSQLHGGVRDLLGQPSRRYERGRYCYVSRLTSSRSWRSWAKRLVPSCAAQEASISATASRITRIAEMPRVVRATRFERRSSGSGWRSR